MADPALVQALDYILNRSDAASLEVLAEAVARRNKSLTGFSPERMTKEITEKLNSGIDIGIKGMKNSVREMIVRIISEHAPELSESQVEELCQAWAPSVTGGAGGKVGGASRGMPPDVLLSMIEQFISYSHGTMTEAVDKGLREEIGEWPKRYWEAFPAVVRQIITDYLKDRIPEQEFKSKLKIALGL